ncbi:MAG: LysR family transcriptional regulator [Pseudomonadota bacterium]
MLQSVQRDIDIALLRTFLAVCETGGMTQAARHLNLTQAAVSQQIKRLEQLLDIALFDRAQRQIRVTAKGERLMAYARKMLALNHEVWSGMTAPAFEGEINLGVPHDLVATFMSPILREFARRWPRVSLILHAKTTPNLLSNLRDGEIDITLTTEPRRAGETLLVDPLVWGSAPDGEAWREEPLPLALGAETCAFRQTALEALQHAGRDWRLSCHVGTLDPAIAMIEADLAVGAFMRCALPPSLEAVAPDRGLPALPDYYLNMHIAPLAAAEPGTFTVIESLAEVVRNGIAPSLQRAAA